MIERLNPFTGSWTCHAIKLFGGEANSPLIGVEQVASFIVGLTYI